MRAAAAALALGLMVVGCGASTAADPATVPPGTLEIGVGEYGSSLFRPLPDGEPVTIGLGPAALHVLPLALRIRDATPSESDPGLTVAVMGQLVVDIHTPWSRESDAPGSWVLDPHWVALLVGPCCVTCREALIEASVETDDGGVLRASVRVQLVRFDYCPDDPPCCESADDCPDPAMARLCEPAPGG